MRILALHGFGSSGKILEMQLTALLQYTDASYEFVFGDGLIPSKKAPGIANWLGFDWLEGPFHSHTSGYSPDEIREAHTAIWQMVEEDGPFDGVLGFSQGAGLALSFLLDSEAEKNPLPFKFAILCSTVNPISSDPACCSSEIMRVSALHRSSSSHNGDMTTNERAFWDLLSLTTHLSKEIGVLKPDYDDNFFAYKDVGAIPRVMHPLLVQQRVRIPTVHIRGKNDHPQLRELQVVSEMLCEPGLTRVIEHGGGHHMPRRQNEIMEAVKGIDWVVKQSEIQSFKAP